MSAETLLGALVGLTLVALTGRLALAWLPAGRPGSHRPARWLQTWAASHLLGVIVLHALLVSASAGDLEWSVLSLGALLAVVGLLRIATLPGDMVPRREPTAPRGTWLTALALLVVGVLALVPVFLNGPGFDAQHLVSLDAWSSAAPWQSTPFRCVSPASRLALVVLVLHGLKSGGLGPLARRAFVMVWLATPMLWSARGVWSDALQPALMFGAGCAFTVAWLRQAERRAGVLAALAFAACPAYDRAALPLAWAGLVCLLAFTHSNARGSILRACGLGLLLSAPALATWPVVLDWEQPVAAAAPSLFPWIYSAGGLSNWGLFWYAVGPALMVGLALALRPRSRRHHLVAPFILVLAFLAAFLMEPHAARFGLSTFIDEGLLLALAPAGVLVLGLAVAHAAETQG